jgi:hypothetical protein
MHAQIALDLSRRRDMRTTPPRPYRLPHAVRDRLQAALEPFRNAERAYALAVFLGRFWSMPGRVALPFPIDRRALADRADLELTEGEVRGAIRTLEAVGFLARWKTLGSRYKATEAGLRRKPVPFLFGPDYMPAFIAANGRAAAARGGQDGAPRYPTAQVRERASATFLGARNRAPALPLKHHYNLPKDKSAAQAALLMGKMKAPESPQAFQPNANLEAALDRLKRAIGKAEAQRGGRGS